MAQPLRDLIAARSPGSPHLVVQTEGEGHVPTIKPGAAHEVVDAFIDGILDKNPAFPFEPTISPVGDPTSDPTRPPTLLIDSPTTPYPTVSPPSSTPPSTTSPIAKPKPICKDNENYRYNDETRKHVFGLARSRTVLTIFARRKRCSE